MNVGENSCCFVDLRLQTCFFFITLCRCFLCGQCADRLLFCFNSNFFAAQCASTWRHEFYCPLLTSNRGLRSDSSISICAIRLHRRNGVAYRHRVCLGRTTAINRRSIRSIHDGIYYISLCAPVYLQRGDIGFVRCRLRGYLALNSRSSRQIRVNGIFLLLCQSANTAIIVKV